MAGRLLWEEEWTVPADAISNPGAATGSLHWHDELAADLDTP
ncbi:hypothetical protein [Streptomyces coeruleorubidus]